MWVWRELEGLKILKYIWWLFRCAQKAGFIIFKIKMHDGMGSVQQNGEKLIRVFALAHQPLQAFNQLTSSVGIKPLLL